MPQATAARPHFLARLRAALAAFRDPDDAWRRGLLTGTWTGAHHATHGATR